MAEGFFNYHNKNSEYIDMSAGTAPSKEVNPMAIEAMKEKGIDISLQKSKILDWDTAQKAFKIFTMGCIKGCPITPRDVTVEWNFDDPAGKPISEFRKVGDEIEQKIIMLINQL